MINWVLEFFGEWECKVAKPLDPSGRSSWFVVCHQHTVSKRWKGYIDMGNGPFRKLHPDALANYKKEYEDDNA